MNESLCQLADDDLRGLVAALRAERLAMPYSPVGMARIVGSAGAKPIANELQSLADCGFSAAHIAIALQLLVDDRSRRARSAESCDLVTTGPEAPGVANRDTGAVVRELFTHAEHSVTVAGFAVYQGRQVFQTLADSMAQRPTLRVRMFLDVQRGHGDTSTASELVHHFAARFKSSEWPTGGALPEIYFDPRSLELDGGKRACLHAKCIVVDRQSIFISSANFTEAAQERNIEVGLLVRSRPLAERVEGHFEALLAAGMLRAAL